MTALSALGVQRAKARALWTVLTPVSCLMPAMEAR